jgi:hypothetical protein
MFSYKDLKTDIEYCLNVIRGLDSEATEDEIQELKGYMQEFMQDVESDHDINCWESILKGDLNDIVLEKIKEWAKSEHDGGRDSKGYIKAGIECLKVLHANRDELPLFIGIFETEPGINLLEKRLKGTVFQYNA